MTIEQLQEIKARLNKTTDTIWRTNMHNEILTSNGVRIGQMIRVQDAEFVIHAREDVPALIEEIERLRKTLEFYAEEMHYRPVTLACGDKEIFIERDCGRIARDVLEGVK